MNPINRSLARLLPVIAALALATPAEAAVPPGLPDCGCEAQTELLAQRDRIAAAADADAAREIALDDVRGAKRALGIATRLAPFSSNLRAARERVDAYARDVALARTPDEVAERFSTFVQVEDGSDIVGVDGPYDGGDGRCSFSNGEIIAIVLGFILGIIPGLILLVLLC